jgi:hypothetical protein
MHLNALSNAKYKWLVCYGLRRHPKFWAANQSTNEDTEASYWSMYVNVILELTKNAIKKKRRLCVCPRPESRLPMPTRAALSVGTDVAETLVGQ